MSKKIINIFDFDGTLIDTQTPEQGKVIWESKTGSKWPYKGWWGRKESLDNNVFEQPVIKSTLEYYNSYLEDDNCLNIMLTGRRKKLSDEVEIILSDNNLVFDEYRYNYGGETLKNKIEQLTEILIKNVGSVETLNMFEDRYEHIVSFKDFLNNLIGKSILKEAKIYYVKKDKTIDIIKL